ncbi:MAG: hypothetical protein WC763_04775 [Candidatus Paceibacterota bacterium]|jgi:hypothetical protein
MKKLLQLLNLIDSFGFIGEVRISGYKDGALVKQTPWMRNKVVSSSGNGRNLILQALSGDYAGSIEITHAELGTGTTAASDSDTDTEDPQSRAQRSFVSVSANIITLKFFFSDLNLPDDSYTEFTMWMDGDVGLGTGSIFNRLVFSGAPYVKATGEDTSIEVRVTSTG